LNAVQSVAAIEVDGLRKSFLGPQGRYHVLDGVALSIAPGEFVSLLGPSGGGKSTLLNILAGLDVPDAGQARIQGPPPAGAPPAAPAGAAAGGPRPIAYMQQKDLLLPWRSLWDNILLGPELRSRAERRRREDEARALLREFRLEAFAQAYPAQLSGGMRQRAALLRTLLCGQPILLLDEPFGALDAITRGRLQKLLLRVWRQYRKTVLLVTHDVEEAVLLSQRVVVLSAMPGRVLAEFGVAIPHEARAESPETLRLRARILKMLEGPDAAA
jgi:ABC-type nitrate/sulfonate/bicarbonate transport system ATPase subunit